MLEMRTFIENYQIKRHLQMINIFVKTAAKSSYPLEMLMNVANSYHIRLLLKLMLVVSNETKLLIISILMTLLRVQIPLKTLELATSQPLREFKTKSTIKFRSSFIQTLYDVALQIKSGTLDTGFKEPSTSLYDVQVCLTRLIRVCYKVKQTQTNVESSVNDELSAIFSTNFAEIPICEKHILLQIMDSFLTFPVCGDKLLAAKEDSTVAKALSMKESENISTCLNDSLNEQKKVFNVSSKSIIVPDVAPDSLIELTLSSEALGEVVARIKQL